MNTDSYAHVFAVFFFNDTATTEIYTLSLHDALPISETRVWGWSGERRGAHRGRSGVVGGDRDTGLGLPDARRPGAARRSEEHTSELQSRQYLVCRLLLEKKNQIHE